MEKPETQTQENPQSRLPAGLGCCAAALLIVSLFFPYWQARLFAPQYRNGLTATMYSYKLEGDIQEIDGLNHYIGMRKLASLARWERLLAIPAVLLLALFCGLAFWRGARGLRMAAAAAVAFYPAVFVADMAFWMSYATKHLDPMAPLKLKPFSIPILGAGRVAQFHSELKPLLGFYLAVMAAILVMEALWLARAGVKTEGKPRSKPVAGAVLAAVLVALARPAAAEPLQALLDAAPAGSIVNLGSGIFEGPAVVSKPLTLRGNGRAVISGGGRGTLVTIKAPEVTLEGLTLTGSGDSLLFEDAGVRVEAASATIRRCSLNDVLFGIFLVHAPGAVIEGNTMRGKPIDLGRRGDLVRGWNSDRMTVRANLLEGGRDFVLWFSTGAVVENNVVRRGRYGLHFMYTNNARVRGNRFSDNSVGFYVMYSQGGIISGNRFERHRGPSGAGLGLKDSDSMTVEGNDFIANRQAVYIDGSPLVAENANTFARNVFARNDIGLSILPGVSGNLFYENVFDDNLQQVSRRGGGPLTGNQWRKNGRGNFWSDYAGYGASGGGVGRIPYKVESAWENLMDRQPLARFFLFTPAAEAVDLASRAFPVFRPKPVLTDESPLLRPPVDLERGRPPAPASWSLPLGLASFSCFLLGLPRLARRRGADPRPSAPQGKAALSVRGLKKSFGGHTVLGGVDLEVKPGQTAVLWGSNGAGKSTLIKCVLGLHEFSGDISVFGHDARQQGEAARARVGYVSQEFSCYDWTVTQAMEFVANLRGVDAAAIEPSLGRCGLSEHGRQRVSDLSGGMKQKLALSQALLADPPLLLLDEPCSNLDARSRRDLLHILEGLRGSRAIVMTSHRADEAERLADSVLWLEEGRPARLMDRKEFRRAVLADQPLWLELESAAAREPAVSLLTSQGYSASLNGRGLWVRASPEAAMTIIRLLEQSGFRVRDMRREVQA